MIKTLLFVLLLGQPQADSVQFIHPAEILEQGAELSKNGNHDKAVELYLKISENDTAYIQVRSVLAATYSMVQQYEKSIEISAKFKDVPSKYRLDFYINLGNAYLDGGNVEKGKQIYKEGLTLFPYSYILIYNLGLAHHKTGNYVEALSYFQKSAKINPYYGNNHIMLGYLSLLQGHTTKAILSYLTYLAINPDKNSTLVFLENIASEVVRPEGSIPEFTDNSDFLFYDELIRSKAALDERFESGIDFNASVAKQSTLLFSKLIYNESSDDFWMQFYVPLFSQIYQRDLHKAFIYFILKSSNKENIQAWLEKHDKERSAWVDAANSAFAHNRSVNKTELLGEKDNYTYWYYSNNALSAIGNEKPDETRTGPWAFFYQNSQINATGRYNDQGQKIGEWLYYHENGRLSRKEVFDEKGGFVEPAVYYHDNGALSVVARYNDKGELHGPLEYYYACGQLREVAPFANDSKTGDGHHYYETGQTKTDYHIEDGQLEGEYTEYFQNGLVQKKYEVTKGLTNGPFKSYHVNEQLEEQGQYVDDKLVGEWIGYHANGGLQYKGAFALDNRKDQWEYHYTNGNIRELTNYNEVGEKHGENRNYTEEGKLQSIITYDRDKIIGLSYYNAKGEALYEVHDEGGNMTYETYYPTGEPLAKGTLKNGKLNGPLTLYHMNGNVKYQVNFVDDLYEGLYEEHFTTGELYIKCYFKEGNKNGHYLQYYKNGKVNIDGWYIDDIAEQWWITYYPDGSLDEEKYLVSGKLNGWNNYYAPGNKRQKSFKYQMDLLTELQQYDTLGNVYHHLDIAHGNGVQARITVAGDTIFKVDMRCGQFNSDVNSYHSNGSLKSRDPLKNGLVDGPYERKRSDGTQAVKGAYKNDLQDGLWQWLYPNGKISSEYHYVAGKMDGPSNRYYYTGKIESKCTFSEDEVTGPCLYFDQQGNHQLTKIYKKDIGHVAYVDVKSKDTIEFINSGSFTLTSHFENGKVAVVQNFFDGKFDGESLWYNADGSLTEKNMYVHGDNHGVSTKYFANGKVYLETPYQNDNKYGLEIEYYENGNKRRETPYINDDVNGFEILYNTNGTVKSKTFYWNGDEY
jgi:antitoxin component YwqK of YwqJK toxin-antitoxin module